MKATLEKLHSLTSHNREWVFGVPIAILFLLAISWLCSLLQSVSIFPESLTEDIGMVVKYSIKGVGLVIALAIAGWFKSWLGGDINEETCSTGKMLVDSITLWVFIALSIWAIFGSTLWL